MATAAMVMAMVMTVAMVMVMAMVPTAAHPVGRFRAGTVRPIRDRVGQAFRLERVSSK